jgi:hypothetical protein
MDDEQLQELETLKAADAITRAKRAGELVAEHQDYVGELSRLRKEALLELTADGKSHGELAKLLGMTRGRVGQLLQSGPKPERALLGTGALTVAAGGKSEPRKATDPSTMLSDEARKAYNLIADAASGYDFTAELEVVPPPGMVRLNRPNLVVLSSPRILPLVGQVLEADANLGFASGAQGWYLTEQATGKVYRSPSDNGAATDYAYIGRLPRPDGKGTFLYLAGIHAMGTLGAAHYLTGNIEQLYEQVKNKRWSALVEVRYDPDSRAIETTERITPVYTA